MSRTIETRDGVSLSISELEQFSPLNCNIYPLSDREVALIISVLRYAEWESRWLNREADFDLVYTLENKLMQTCDITLQLTRIANALYYEPDLGQLRKVAEAGVTDSMSIAQIMGDAEGINDYTEELSSIAQILGAAAAAA